MPLALHLQNRMMADLLGAMIVTVMLLLMPPCGVLCVQESIELERTLSARLNPGCPDNICGNRTEITLIHIEARSATDTIHYIWDFTGKPTILVALTSSEAQMNIDWDKFMDTNPQSVTFSERPRYTFMAVINRIFQFNDRDDQGILNNDSEVLVYDPHNFNWTRSLFWWNDWDTMAAINAGSDFLFKLNAYSTKDHGMEYPHLLHSSNSTQIDIVFNNVTNRFDSPRFAIELIFVVSEQAVPGSDFKVTKRKSLDDEHTPGIFEIVDILSPGAFQFSTGGYLEYRPVSYTHPERDVASTTETHQSQPVTIDSPAFALKSTLAYAVFGAELDRLLVQGMNVSFGFTEDGFYKKTNYTTMTFQVGYGVPPVEELSAFVLLVVGIGIGVPALAMLVGVVYVCVRRARNSAQQRLN